MNTLKEMVVALVDLGLSQTQIAKEAGVQQPTVSRVLSGKEVLYEKGKKLEEFYFSKFVPPEKQRRRATDLNR